MSQILQGDCLELMKDIPDGSVDLVLTDPPYGARDGKDKIVKRGTNRLESFNAGDWDTALPLEWIGEAIRVLKDGCWIVIFTDNLSVGKVWDEIEKTGGNPKQTFYWIKNNPPPQPRKNFCSGVETAVLATKGSVKKWNTGGWNLNYFKAPLVGGKERTKHTTQKPVSLMEYLAVRLSVENDVIFDPFAGSGTTGVAAKNLNRDFILIEKEPEYVEIIKERLGEYS